MTEIAGGGFSVIKKKTLKLFRAAHANFQKNSTPHGVVLYFIKNLKKNKDVPLPFKKKI